MGANGIRDMKRNSVCKIILRHKELYILCIPGIIYLIMFKYIPMYGVTVAFKDFNIYKGFWDSEWVGLQNFFDLFTSQKFYQVLINNILISVYKIIFRLPAPILIALFLNEIRKKLFKRSVQTILYLPHFISWVVIAGIFIDLLSPNDGLVNSFLKQLGIDPVFFLAESRFFRSIVIFTDIWRNAGFGAILYLAAISSINQELYEAAIIDGAGRFKQMLYITLPGIASTIGVIFILFLGQMMYVDTEQILMFLNPAVYDVGDVINTYVYRVGLGKMEFNLTSTAGLFQSVIGLVMIVVSNSIAKRYSDTSVW